MEEFYMPGRSTKARPRHGHVEQGGGVAIGYEVIAGHLACAHAARMRCQQAATGLGSAAI